MSTEDSYEVLDKLLNNVERFSCKPTSWSTRSVYLTFSDVGMKEATTALLHLVINRWLPVIEWVSDALSLYFNAYDIVVLHHPRNTWSVSRE